MDNQLTDFQLAMKTALTLLVFVLLVGLFVGIVMRIIKK